MLKRYHFSFRLLALAVCTVVAIGIFYQPMPGNNVSAEQGELRGVWVSTVSNIDYPSSQTTDPAALKKELTAILDHCESMGFNAVFFQVRPASDAFYKSEIFPWSRYLTGTQGIAPKDGFDPLAFAVEEAHDRGMELHAWINPYRITASASDKDLLARDNPAVLRPELVLTDSNGKMYYNPGDSASIQLIVDGAVEIVKNYDVDGIHMDDYFYPDSEFDDDGTYSFYQKEYPDKGDWRRAMVNKMVKQMDEAVHAEKPEVAFGISPRGIWANDTDMPGGSATRGGGSYTTVYADSKAWVENGWVDYIMPQIYWNIGYEIADYSILCDWWSDVVKDTDVKLYIGEGAYRTVSSTTPAWTGENGTDELKRHIFMGRENKNISGYCMFTYNTFLANPSIDAMMQEVNAILPEPEKGSAGEEVPSLGGASQSDKPVDEEYINQFTDMDDYWWAMDEVNALASQGIIKGQSETKFAPDAYITRADNIVLLLRILGKKSDFIDNFADVSPDAYYYQEIGIAKALGIALGGGDGCFYPTGLIKRQDMSTLAYRVLSAEGVLTSIPNTGVLNQFLDKDSIDFYARDAMAACVGAGLMSGYGDGWINPQGNATRIEVALFMYRIQNLLGQDLSNVE
ncbi:MAG: family 10 glycosylhydrolase [Clostridia bacterium]|nr:family 10 glycosylhydrolase [Clostridia bacterium]